MQRHAHEIADRDDPRDASLIHHREVAEAPVDHEGRGVVGLVGSVDRLRMSRHPLGDARLVAVTTRDRSHEIPLREDALELISVEHQNGADPAGDHSLRRLSEPVVCRDGQKVAGHVVGDERHGRLILKLLQQGVDPPRYLIAYAPDLVELKAGRIFELPVDITPAGDVGTLVAATHGDDDVRPLGVEPLETTRRRVRELGSELLHHLDDLRVNLLGRPRARGARLVLGSLLAKQGCRHLRAPGVLDADEQDVGYLGTASSL